MIFKVLSNSCHSMILWILWHTTWKSAKRMETGFYHWCPVIGEETVSTNWNRGSSHWSSDNTFLLWWWPSTGRECPEVLWISLLGDIQKQAEHDPGQLDLCLSRGLGPYAVQRSLQTSTVLWFCELLQLYLSNSHPCPTGSDWAAVMVFFFLLSGVNPEQDPLH